MSQLPQMLLTRVSPMQKHLLVTDSRLPDSLVNIWHFPEGMIPVTVDTEVTTLGPAGQLLHSV